MSKLRVLIADDELVARKRLTRLVTALPEVELVGECASGEEVLARVREQRVDVLLLDIQMPGLTGLDAMALLPADGPYVIFCTAHPDHAVQAFDVGAVDYVLKPIEAGRLQKAIERAATQLAQRRRVREAAAATAPGNATPVDPQRLAIPTRNGIVLVDPAQISHAVLDGELVTVFTADAEYLTDFTLQELEAKLPPGKLERVHRRALLNLDHVVRLEPLETGGFIARTRRGHAVDVSRQAARELRRRFGLRRGPADEGEP